MRFLLIIMVSFLSNGLYAFCSKTKCKEHPKDALILEAHQDQFLSSSLAYIHSQNECKDGKSTINVIVLDPGHGGRDDGCSGSDSKEKIITLSLAKKLKQLLAFALPEVQVVLTRDKDVFVPLHERAAIANNLNADLFLSLHCNYIRNAKYLNGTEIYVMGVHSAEENLEVAKRENACIKLENLQENYYDGYDPDSAEGHILLSMYQNASLEQSLHLGQAIETQIASDEELKSRGVLQAGFVVLRTTTMPSILIETGYLSNEEDQILLNSDQGQNRVCDAIFTGIVNYKDSIEDAALVSPSDILETVEVNLENQKPFKLLVLKSQDPLNIQEAIWSNFPFPLEVIFQENSYHYIASGFGTIDEAETAKEALLERGFKDVSIFKSVNN